MVFHRTLPPHAHIARIAKRNSDSDSAELEASRRRYIEKKLHCVAEANRTEFLVNWLAVDKVQHDKELSRKVEKHRLELSEKEEEHRRELSRKDEQRERELSVKVRDHAQKIVETAKEVEEAWLYKAAAVVRTKLHLESVEALYPRGQGSKPTNRKTLWVFLLSTKNAAEVPEASHFRHRVLSQFCPQANSTSEKEEECIQLFGHVVQKLFGDVPGSEYGILQAFGSKIGKRLMKDEKKADSLAWLLGIGYDLREHGIRAIRIILEPIPVILNNRPIRTKQQDYFSRTRAAIYPKDEYEDFKDVEITNVKNFFAGLDMESAVVKIGKHTITVDFNDPGIAMSALASHPRGLENTPKNANEKPYLYEVDDLRLLMPVPEEEEKEKEES